MKCSQLKQNESQYKTEEINKMVFCHDSCDVGLVSASI